MKHYGDITKLSGYDLPIVDCLVGGSPCQDLSMAGKRAGLGGERSGLFMEQIRLVKEMREKDARTGRSGYMVRPRYLIWENVPGAFSSNNGEDFNAVLSAIIRIAEPGAPNVPMPEKNRWSKSGCFYDELGKWSVAWRLHNSQFWGVPQRRKRISLVADFGGLSAPEILFERNGLSRDIESRGEAWERAAGTTGGGVKSASGFSNRGYCSGSVTETLRSDPHGAHPCVAVDAYNHTITGDIAATLNASSCDSPTHSGPSVLQLSEPIPIHDQATRFKGKRGEKSDGKGNGIGIGEAGDPANTLSTADRHAIWTTSKASYHTQASENIVAALVATDHKDPPIVTAVDFQNSVESEDTNGTLQSKASNNLNSNNVCRIGTIVRRLTPLECERLQGMPDNWSKYGINENGEVYELPDSARYKLQGNGIATPFWRWLMKRISAQYERAPTLGSLFDGQASFPMIWEGINGKGTALWSSEIEKHAVAVAKYHFPED